MAAGREGWVGGCVGGGAVAGARKRARLRGAERVGGMRLALAALRGRRPTTPPPLPPSSLACLPALCSAPALRQSAGVAMDPKSGAVQVDEYSHTNVSVPSATAASPAPRPLTPPVPPIPSPTAAAGAQRVGDW